MSDELLDWGDSVPFVGFLVTDTATDETIAAICSHELDCVADHGPPTRWWLLSDDAKNNLCYRRMLTKGFDEVLKTDLTDTVIGDVFGRFLDKASIVVRLSDEIDFDEMDNIEDDLFNGTKPPPGFLYRVLGPFPLAKRRFPELEELLS